MIPLCITILRPKGIPPYWACHQNIWIFELSQISSMGWNSGRLSTHPAIERTAGVGKYFEKSMSLILFYYIVIVYDVWRLKTCFIALKPHKNILLLKRKGCVNLNYKIRVSYFYGQRCTHYSFHFASKMRNKEYQKTSINWILFR